MRNQQLDALNVLVFNCGSSSLKYRLIRMPFEEELAAGEAQRVGPKTSEPSQIVHIAGGEQEVHYFEMADHAAAFERIMELLKRSSEHNPHLLGHRLVHGGNRFTKSTFVDERVLSDLEEVRDLAPLHNPPAITLVNACRNLYPDLPQVLVFDTVYHATIPEYAYTYALPSRIREDLHIRKYGFHGISHRFVVTESAKYLNIPLESFNAVSCHLGSGGASLCAVKGGRSMDNTMGYSPLQGLIMSTRCGDLDPAVTLQLLDESDGDHQAVDTLLNRRSGVLGMSGMSADIRDVLNRISPVEKQESPLKQAAQVYLWRIRKYLGSYLAVTGSPHAVIFTDTIGETVPHVRWAVCTGMEEFGLKLDPEKNQNVDTYPADISTGESKIRILVVKTNEEVSIARDAYSCMCN